MIKTNVVIGNTLKQTTATVEYPIGQMSVHADVSKPAVKPYAPPGHGLAPLEPIGQYVLIKM